MLTHEQIMALRLLTQPATDKPENGNVCVNIDMVAMTKTPVFYSINSKPEYFNLLAGAAFMYQTLETQKKAFAEMIKHAEATGADSMAAVLMQFESGSDIALRIAREGVDSIRTVANG